MTNREILKKTYESLLPFSSRYEVDFKRFLFSLNLLSGRDVIEGKKFLDIGSGIGIMAISLKNLGAEVIGIDKFIFPDEGANYYSVPDFEKLEGVWNKEGIRVLKGDLKNSLPFSNGSFDAVLCDATIEHLPESPKELFKEVYRVLKKDGIFLLTTPNLTNLLRRLRFLFGRSPHWDLKDFFDSESNYKGHWREFTPKEVIKMLEWSFFDIVEVKTKNVFFNAKRLLGGRRFLAQICSVLSFPFPSAREMIYVLASKN